MTTLSVARAVAASSPWLLMTPPAFRDALLEKSRLITLNPGDELYPPGNDAGGMSCLITGQLKVIISASEQGPNFVHLFSPGEWTGYGSLITGQPRLVGHMAVHLTELIWVDIGYARSLLNRDPTGWRYLALLSFYHLRIALQTIEDLMLRESEHRLAAIILRLAGCRWEDVKPGPVSVKITQTDLAAMANMGRTALTECLAELERAGIVQLSYGTILLSNPAALRSLLKRDGT